jgi:hypothetical protein
VVRHILGGGAVANAFQIASDIDAGGEANQLRVLDSLAPVLLAEALAWRPTWLSHVLDRHQRQSGVENVPCLLLKSPAVC